MDIEVAGDHVLMQQDVTQRKLLDSTKTAKNRADEIEVLLEASNTTRNFVLIPSGLRTH